MSDSVQRKAREIFPEEIVKDEMQLVSAAGDGRTEMVIKLLSTNLIDVNCAHNPRSNNVGLLHPFQRDNGNYAARRTHYAPRGLHYAARGMP